MSFLKLIMGGAAKPELLSLKAQPDEIDNTTFEIPLDCIQAIHQIAGQQTYLEIFNRMDPEGKSWFISFNMSPDLVANNGVAVPLDKEIPNGARQSTGANIQSALEYLARYRAEQDYSKAPMNAVFKVSAENTDPKQLAPVSLQLPTRAVKEISKADIDGESTRLSSMGYPLVPIWTRPEASSVQEQLRK